MRFTLKKIITPSIPLAVFLVAGCLLIWFVGFLSVKNNVAVFVNSESVGLLQRFFIPYSIISNLLSLAFTVLNAFLLAQLNNRYTIIRTRTFLPVLIFLLLISCWPNTHLVNGSHLALTLLVLSLFMFFGMYHDRKSVEQAFAGSLFIAVGSLIIPPLAFLIPVCWLGFIWLQSISLRTFLASFFGALTPWVIYLSIRLYLQPDFAWTGITAIYEAFVPQFVIANVNIVQIINIVCLMTVLIIGLVGMYSNLHSDAIHTRAKLNFLILLLVSSLVLAVLYSNQYFTFLPFIALSYSLLLSHSLTLKTNNFYGIVFAVFCVINVAYLILEFIFPVY